jgi:tetratricopeptide (TPR) repeat protein
MPTRAVTAFSGAGREPPSADLPRWVIAAGAGLIVVAALAAWHNSFSGAFVFDDVPVVTDNPSIRHLWPPWDALALQRTDLTVSGRPLVNFSLAVNYALGGTNVRGYHAMNLAIHVLAGLALFGLVRRTLILNGLTRMIVVVGRGRRTPPQLGTAASGDAALPWHSALVALAAALLWTVHPLQTEAVTYVVQRVESLMGLFYLLTLYCFVRGVESSRPATWQVLSMTACLAGMACKEVMVSAPLMVLLYDRTFVAGSFRTAWQLRWRLYAGLAATWLLLAWLVVSTTGRGGSAGFGTAIAWWAYALTQCQAVVHYLRLVVWPHPLVFDYGLDAVGSVAAVAPQALLLAVLLAGTVVALWRRPAVGFLGAWFFLVLAPSSSVVPVATQTMAEHRMYLPLAAVIVLAAAGLFRLLGLRAALLGCAALSIAFGWITMCRNVDYRSEFSIWNDTAHKRPDNARAHSNLGSLWLKQGNPAKAMSGFTKALQLQPYYASAHFNLGVALAGSGRPAEAVPHFEAAVRIEPDFADAHIDLGIALTRLGRAAEALEHYRVALRLQPASPDAHVDLGLALMQLDRPAEAIEHYEMALRLQPGLPGAQAGLGAALLKAGRTEAAIQHYEAAVRLTPDRADFHSGLADALAQAGDLAAAEREYTEAVRLKPDAIESHFALGNVLAGTGRLAGAIAEYQQVLRLDPARIQARNNLGNALLMAGRVDEAIAEYQQVLRVRPDDISVRENLEQARTLQQVGPPAR